MIRMSKMLWLLVVTVLLSIIISSAIQAMPNLQYWVQDDYRLTFGTIGDPLSVNTKLRADGRIVNWDVNQVVGWFSMRNLVVSQKIDLGSRWEAKFTSGTFTLLDENDDVLWNGTVDYLNLIINKDSSKYPVAGYYDRPSFESDPDKFTGVGSAKFTRASGAWIDSNIFMSWLGTYNWNYNQVSPSQSTYLVGNLQGKLFVPEPAGIIALMTGFVGVFGVVRRKRAY